jgi:hypothetical protein
LKVIQRTTPKRRFRPARLFGLALLVTAVLAPATPASAAPAVSITGYKITSNLPAFPTVPSNGPSTLQAGANPDAGSFTAFAYSNGTEDLKTALTNFAPGLLGNPEAVPKCSEAALQAGGATCPPGSAIGTSRLDTVVAGTTFPAGSFPGVVYNAEPLDNEPGRLGVVTPTGLGTLVSSIPFTITPRGASDYGLTGTLTDINPLSSPPFPANLQVSALAFVINGSTNKYVRNPTSCGDHVSTGQAIGYDDPTTVDGPAYTFTTSGCDQVAFSPTLSIQIGDRGTTKANGYPPVVVKITQPAGQADELGNKITLPVELNPNNTAYKLCTQAQADADACPSNSHFGGVVAKSPFLSEPLVGPVYLVQQSGRSLPGLLLDLRGRAHVKVQTTTQLVNGKQVQSLVLGTPQLPVSELTVALNGGKSTGVFQNRSNLCFQGDSTSKFNAVNALVKFYGWNGKNSSDTKVAAKVIGCGAAVKGSLSNAIGGSPRLKITATKHPDAPNMKDLTVSLGRNLSLVKSKLQRGGTGTASAITLGGQSFEYVNRHQFKVTGLPSSGSPAVTVSLRKGAVRVSRQSRKLLNRGKSRRFSVKVRQTPTSGAATSTRTKFKVKGRR